MCVVQIIRGKAKPTITTRVNSSSNFSCKFPLRCSREAHPKVDIQNCVQGDLPLAAVNRLLSNSPANEGLEQVELFRLDKACSTSFC